MTTTAIIIILFLFPSITVFIIAWLVITFKAIGKRMDDSDKIMNELEDNNE